MASWVIFLILAIICFAGAIIICVKQQYSLNHRDPLKLLGLICWAVGSVFFVISGLQFNEQYDIPNSIKYVGKTYYLQTEPPQEALPVTIVDENTIIVNGETYVIKR